MNGRVVFRLDANSTIGFGHFVRCQSIASEIEPLKSTFASLDNLSNSLKSTHDFLLLNSENDFFDQIDSTDIIVLDGYQFDHAYHKKIKAIGSRLVVIDDLAQINFYTDAIINHTPSIPTSAYTKNMDAMVFNGLDYSMLRAPFLDLAQTGNLQKEANSILVCFGGSDPLNKTAQALEAIISYRESEFNKINVVLGNGFAHFEQLKSYIVDQRIMIYRNLNEFEMAALMSKTEFAILPSSGILLEGIAAQMKIISGYYVENQKYVYKSHLALGTFVNAFDFSINAIHSALSELPKFNFSKVTIDGLSLSRIHRIFQQLIIANESTLRHASEVDTQITYQWANDPAIRAHSFNQELIPFDHHQKWFYSKMQSAECLYGILEHQSEPIGSIRFDLSGTIATISYLLDPKMHGKGFGTILLKLGLETLAEQFTENEIHVVQGFVMPENTSSIKAFERFGFSKKLENGVFLFTQRFKSNA